LTEVAPRYWNSRAMWDHSVTFQAWLPTVEFFS